MAGRLHDLLLRRLAAVSGKPPVVAVPFAHSPEILGCIVRAQTEGAARFILVGPRELAEEAARAAGLSLEGAEFRECPGSAEACVVAAGLAAVGEAQSLMKGQVQTAEFIHAILGPGLGLVAPGGLLSHVAVFDLPFHPRLLFVTDAAITPQANVAQKVELIRNAAGVARALGVTAPRVALVGPVEKPSSKLPSTMDAAEVVRRASAGELGPDLVSAEAARQAGAAAGAKRSGPAGPGVPGPIVVDGPFALDVAVSPEAAAVKGIAGPVAGVADILVLPGLDAANVLYKSLTSFTLAAVGGIVAGARVPIVLTSRADSEDTKFDSLLLAQVVGLPWTV